MNSQSMNNTTTTNSILPSAEVRRIASMVNNAHPQGFYDVAPLKPKGRGEIETCRDSEAKLLHCRKNLKMETFNLLTMASEKLIRYYKKNRRYNIEYAKV